MNSQLRKMINIHRKVSPNTLKTYECHLNGISKQFNNGKKIYKPFIRENIDKILEFYKGTSEAKFNGVVSVILVLLSPKGKFKQAKRDTELYNKINSILTTQLKKYEDDKIKQVKTKKEEENWIEFADIRKWIENNYKDIMTGDKKRVGYFEGLQKLLIVMLYHFIPPRRLDYSDMIITTEEQYNKMDKRNVNAFVITPQKDIFSNDPKLCYGSAFISFGADLAKSKREQDCVIVQMGGAGCRLTQFDKNRAYDEFPPIVRILVERIVDEIPEDENGNYMMLRNSNGDKLSKPSMTKLIKKIYKKEFGKSAVGASLLRKIYLSNMKEIDMEKRKRVAEIMNHKVMTGLTIYTKKD